LAMQVGLNLPVPHSLSPRQRLRALPGPAHHPGGRPRATEPRTGHGYPLVRVALRPYPLEGDDSGYTMTKMPEALIRYLPYLITALGAAAPMIGTVGVALSDQVKDRFDA
jgi:hypothetical protein